MVVIMVGQLPAGHMRSDVNLQHLHTLVGIIFGSFTDLIDVGAGEGGKIRIKVVLQCEILRKTKSIRAQLWGNSPPQQKPK